MGSSMNKYRYTLENNDETSNKTNEMKIEIIKDILVVNRLTKKLRSELNPKNPDENRKPARRITAEEGISEGIFPDSEAVIKYDVITSGGIEQAIAEKKAMDWQPDKP